MAHKVLHICFICICSIQRKSKKKKKNSKLPLPMVPRGPRHTHGHTQWETQVLGCGGDRSHNVCSSFRYVHALQIACKPSKDLFFLWFLTLNLKYPHILVRIIDRILFDLIRASFFCFINFFYLCCLTTSKVCIFFPIVYQELFLFFSYSRLICMSCSPPPLRRKFDLHFLNNIVTSHKRIEKGNRSSSKRYFFLPYFRFSGFYR